MSGRGKNGGALRIPPIGEKCKGSTVIRHPRDHKDPDLRGQPILNADGAREYRPCEAWAANGTEYCQAHGGSAPQTINAARRALALAAERAAMGIIATSEDERVPPETRLKAQAQILDRVGVRAGVDVGLETPGYMDVLAKMFGREEPSTQDDLAPTPLAEETPPEAPVRKRTKATPAKAKPRAEPPKFEGWE